MAADALSAILISAGESTRMGQPKAALPWQGTTLLQYQVSSLLQASCRPIIIVLGHQSIRLRHLVPKDDRVNVTMNRGYREGKATSIKAGLLLLDPEAKGVLISAVDQPRPPAMLKQLLEEHLSQQALITAPSYQGRGGHPIIFSMPLLNELRNISEMGKGLQEIMQRHAHQVHRVPMDSPMVCLDINTQEEYQQALALFDSASG